MKSWIVLAARKYRSAQAHWWEHMTVEYEIRETKSWEHKDWREEAMCKIEKESGRGCCCPFLGVSRNPRRDQTFDELEVAAGMKRHEQAVVASQQQQQQAFHGRPMGLRYEVRMAGLVLRQAWQQAWSHTCSVLDSGLELVEQENSGN